jgi:ATP-dependent Clp protease ATP-binding subunit ClpB
MNEERYTHRVLDIIQDAHQMTLASDHQFLTLFHLGKSLIRKEKKILEDLKINVDHFDKLLTNELSKLTKVTGSAIQLDTESAKFFAKLTQKNSKEITIYDFLQELSKIPPLALLCPKDLSQKISELRRANPMDDHNQDALTRYTKDLTQLVRDGKIDPVIGRDEEIRRTIQVLSRRTKNNPVLIGEPGVGKTAIAEGLAQRIVAKDVPESMRSLKVLVLDLAGLLAGAKYRGEFEERLKGILVEITKRPNEIVLFIDELHTLVGAGKTDGAMDASNMLKPALARGELRCIGATTLDEYRQYIEKDAALARRFQSVYVEEPSVDDAVSILRGIKEKYELHHGVRISDAAVVAACTYSNRYISDRFLPDKAIDLMDEAASRLRMTLDSKPEDIDELDRRIIQLKIEKEALKKEKDLRSKERLVKLEDELKNLEKNAAVLNEGWNQKKSSLDKIRRLKSDYDQAKIELDQAQLKGNLAKAGEILYSILPNIEKKIKNLELSEDTKEEVKEEDIALIVSRWTGIPIEKMMEVEKSKLLHIEQDLKKRVIGQDDALTKVAKAIRRSRAGLSDPKRPIGSFLFLGPTGVGKTELTKALAFLLFDDETHMVRIDMSEYMEKHSVSRLIGAPPGYVGYEQGGALTEAIRRRPYSVILLDEVEKANAEVFNILLQVLDDGRLTDGQGRVVNFKNTIIIMTSNLGSEFLIQESHNTNTTDLVMSVVRGHFRPEFLNRLDDMIIFHPLRMEDMGAIINIQIGFLNQRLKEQSMVLILDDSAKNYLAKVGYDPNYGARPLKRLIQRIIEDPLALMIIDGSIHKNQSITAKEKDGDIIFDVL